MVRDPAGWATYALFVVASVAAFTLVQLEVTEPYMDEPFHVPQAQRYCRGDYWTWDPKLTTPPGLYLLSLAPITIFSLPCSLSVLRATNLALLLALPWILSVLLSSFRPRSSKGVSSLADASVIAFFPTLWFFGHLYYTDIGSVTLILAAWAASRRGRHLAASLLGLVSLTFRQTNIVWLAFIAGSALLDRIAAVSEIGKTVTHGKHRRHLRREQKLAADYDSFSSFVSTVLQLPQDLLAHPSAFLPLFACYGPSFLAFLVFIKWNEGIVLGHQEYHGVSIHLPQLGYFFAFATALGGVALLDVGVKLLAVRWWRDAFGSFVRTAETSFITHLALTAVKNFTIAHPFLLADNRHFPFYVWRRVINATWFSRDLLAVVYVACGIAWGGRLLRTQPPLPLLLFLLCTFATLVPTPLIEPRYFLTPFVIMRILASTTPPQLNTSSAAEQKGSSEAWRAWVVVLEGSWYAVVNLLVTTLFLNVTFKWEGEEGPMRFMW